MNEYVVVGLGEALWDIRHDEKAIGGAPANFAYHVSQFGLPAYVASAVSDDPLGRELTAELARRGLSLELGIVDYPTGRVLVDDSVSDNPQYDICENSAWDYIPFTPGLEALAQRTRAVCFGTLAQRSPVSRDTIRRFLHAMPSDISTLKVCDINLRQHFYSEDIVRQSLSCCNILKINDEELSIVASMLGYPEANQQAQCRSVFRDYALKILILTCGERGSYVFTPDSEYFRDTPRVKVANTVGAGDSFTAAFIATLLRGGTITDAHSCAAATSAYVCTHYGAMPELPPSIKQ